jgi:hypothetical protein
VARGQLLKVCGGELVRLIELKIQGYMKTKIGQALSKLPYSAQTKYVTSEMSTL